jgi:transcriptional regulator GlxA family with amidase domain
MKRRDFLSTSASAGIALAAVSLPSLPPGASPCLSAGLVPSGDRKLPVPVKGPISVAVAISPGVTVIDFAGPWEVFQDVTVKAPGASAPDRDPFELFTVAEKIETIRGSGGLQLTPDHTFATAPQPNIVVVPAQKGSPALHEWLRKVSQKTDVTMSVCTGAFQLARAGLLSGKAATTHHDFADNLAKLFPDIDVKRGVRFVEGDQISTAGGLSSGIDLALRVVERYFGRDTAQATAFYMEYQGKGWIV